MTATEMTENAYNRVASLYDYGILDTESRERFHRLTKVIATLLDVPIVVFSFFDRDTQCYRSHLGFDDIEIAHDLKEFGLCCAASQKSEPLIVGDTLTHELLSGHPLVSGNPKLRFYAGFPLITRSGALLGTLCAMDHQPRQITQDKLDAVISLTHILLNEIELQQINNQLVARNWELEEEVDILQHKHRELENMSDFGQNAAIA